MAENSPFNPNEPNQSTKPPDFSSSVIGQPPPVIPIPNTGPTPTKSGPTPSKTTPNVETLGGLPCDAAATPNGGPPIGQPTLEAPPLGDSFGGPFPSQTLAPAVLPSEPSRKGMPAPSGPFVSTNSPPIADAPYSASLISSQLLVPTLEEALPRADSSRATMPQPQAPTCASIQKAKPGVPNSVGLHFDPFSEPSKALDPIVEDPSDANVPAPALPARTARTARAPVVRQQAAQRATPANFSVPLRLPNFSAPNAPGPHVFPQEAQSALNNGRKTYASAVTDRQTISPSERSMRKSFASILQSAP
ncbi:hypothetical protein Adt_26242 [Abeliophyllum distichum]|uniref:Uncharacterized protein n=1 Tax=Abeliophyllum distichum TaxID=126358 RepID=A0ABD1RUD5_9LAMI